MAKARWTWFHRFVFGLGVLFLAGQLGFTQALFVNRQARSAFPAGQNVVPALPPGPATPVGPDTPFIDFVAAQAPPGTGVLLVTPDAGIRATQEYFELSDRLYPAQVWWAAPAPHTSAVDWWIQTPLDPAALQDLARRRGTQVLAFDGQEPPPGLPGERVEFSPARAVVRVK